MKVSTTKNYSCTTWKVTSLKSRSLKILGEISSFLAFGDCLAYRHLTPISIITWHAPQIPLSKYSSVYMRTSVILNLYSPFANKALLIFFLGVGKGTPGCAQGLHWALLSGITLSRAQQTTHSVRNGTPVSSV